MHPKKILSLLLSIILLTGGVPAAFAGETGVTRVSCVVYADGATGRGFCWFTGGRANSDVQLIKTADWDGGFENAKTYTGKATFYRGRYSHQVAVTDLEPGTVYTYRVGDAETGVWSEPGGFVTDDRDGGFSFIAIADVQAGTDENFALAARTLRAATDMLPDAEFYTNLGDYVNDNTNDEWDYYFQNFAFAHNALTHVPVAGNHDGNITNKLNTCCFQNTFCLDRSDNRSLEGVYYSFDYGNAHFAVLNTNDMYPMSQAQKNWLENDMSASAATWKILLMHRSLYSAGKNINKPDTVAMRNDLLPIIDRLGIDLVLAGHDHMYLRTKQMRGDRVLASDQTVTELFRGRETVFTVDPAGTCYVIPATAGTKRYAVNENAMPPIHEAAAFETSTRELGGCFATVEIEDGRLVYSAYTVDDATGATSLLDMYAVKKTRADERAPAHRDQTLAATVYCYPFNLLKALAGLFVSYLKLLGSLLK